MTNIQELQKECHRIAKSKGFWDTERNNGELIALMHSELSEALEAIRNKDLLKLPEELADVVIRVFDFCEARNIDLNTAIELKMEINRKRPYKHNKLF